jgi:hypothetical protein
MRKNSACVTSKQARPPFRRRKPAWFAFSRHIRRRADGLAVQDHGRSECREQPIDPAGRTYCIRSPSSADLISHCPAPCNVRRPGKHQDVFDATEGFGLAGAGGACRIKHCDCVIRLAPVNILNENALIDLAEFVGLVKIDVQSFGFVACCPRPAPQRRGPPCPLRRC